MENILNVYLQKNSSLPDLILFGYGWENDIFSENGYSSNIHGLELNLEKIRIRKAFILNKEYKNLDQKLNFIRKNRFSAAFTVHHKFQEYAEKTNTKFYQLPFAANESVFKDYGEEKKIDIGFSGNMFNYGVYKKTNIMGKEFQNIRENIFNELQKTKYKDLNIWWNSNSGNFLYGTEYGRLINSAKIWLNTPSAIQIIGTRFYEVIASKTLLLCRESEQAYKDLGFKGGETCVFFNSDLTDLEEKIFYYLKNQNEREHITSNAYNMFLKNHTWKHRARFVIDKIREN
jgi:spore maturation protein CgeB